MWVRHDDWSFLYFYNNVTIACSLARISNFRGGETLNPHFKKDSYFWATAPNVFNCYRSWLLESSQFTLINKVHVAVSCSKQYMKWQLCSIESFATFSTERSLLKCLDLYCQWKCDTGVFHVYFRDHFLLNYDRKYSLNYTTQTGSSH